MTEYIPHDLLMTSVFAILLSVTVHAVAVVGIVLLVRHFLRKGK